AAGKRGVICTSAAHRRTQIHVVRIRPIGMATGSGCDVVDGRTRWAVDFHFKSRGTRLPGESPEIPARAVEVQLNAPTVARLDVAADDSEGPRPRRTVVRTAQFGGEAVVVVGDVAFVRPFLHCEDLALIALGPFVGALNHHGALAVLQVHRQGITHEADVIEELKSLARDELSGAI